MPTRSDIENEDWLRGRSWDIRLPDGKAAETFDEVVYALGATDRRKVARDLMTLPFGKAAPEEVVAGALDCLASAAPEEKVAEEKRLGSIARRVIGAVNWDPDLHPRDYRGRFIRKGDLVELPGGRGSGTAVGNDADGNVVVEDWRGARRTVPAVEVVSEGPVITGPGRVQGRDIDPMEATGADEDVSLSPIPGDQEILTPDGSLVTPDGFRRVTESIVEEEAAADAARPTPTVEELGSVLDLFADSRVDPQWTGPKPSEILAGGDRDAILGLLDSVAAGVGPQDQAVIRRAADRLVDEDNVPDDGPEPDDSFGDPAGPGFAFGGATPTDLKPDAPTALAPTPDALARPDAYGAALEDMEAAFGAKDFDKAQAIQRALIAASRAGGFTGKGNRKSDGKPFGTGYLPADPRNDPAYDEYCDDLDTKIKAAMAEHGDTQRMYDMIDGVENAYRPEREALHEQMLDDLMAQYAHVPRERKAIILAGPSGAGKSTVIKQSGATFGVELDAKGNPTNFAVLNPDDIKEAMIARGMVPDAYLDAGIADNETSGFTHEESSHITKRLRARLVAEGYNVIVDGTFAGKEDKKRKEVLLYKSAGYTVTGVLVDGSMPKSFSNAALRHQNPPREIGGRYKGRYVSYDIIGMQAPSGKRSRLFGREHHSQNAENFETLVSEFDGGAFVFPAGGEGDGRPVYSIPPTAGVVVTENVTVSDAVQGKAAFHLPDGTPVYVDDSMPVDTVEIRNGEGKVLATIVDSDISDTATGGQEGSPEVKAGGRGHAGHMRTVESEPGGEPNENPEPTGVMVALYPPDDVARAFAVDGGEAAQELHVTLAYLGTVDEYDDAALDGLVAAAREFADDSYEISGTFNGLGTFHGTDPEQGDPHVALLDAPDLADFRADVVDMVEGAGLTVRTDHGFTPHMTLRYGGDAPEPLGPTPVTFGFLSVAIGGRVWDFPMAADSGESDGDDVPVDDAVGDTASDESPAPDGAAAAAGGDEGGAGA